MKTTILITAIVRLTASTFKAYPVTKPRGSSAANADLLIYLDLVNLIALYADGAVSRMIRNSRMMGRKVTGSGVQRIISNYSVA